ncbi:MAG: hypothetical protein ACTS3F_02375 [Phycisphaerales bacterium]
MTGRVRTANEVVKLLRVRSSLGGVIRRTSPDGKLRYEASFAREFGRLASAPAFDRSHLEDLAWVVGSAAAMIDFLEGRLDRHQLARRLPPEGLEEIG